MRPAKPKTALVTGVAGYLGSNTARRLLADGWHVHGIVRPASSLVLLDDLHAQLSLCADDGSRDLADVVRETDADVVFHLAGRFVAEHKGSDVVPLVEDNILFGVRLADAMASAGVRNLVNTGTSWQHYRDAAYDPVCLYAATKEAFEAVLRFYVSTHVLNVVSLHLFDSYGPRDPRPKLFTLLRRAAEEGACLKMSPGEQLLDLVYIDDVVEALITAANRLLSGNATGHEVYSVSSGTKLTLKELVSLYGEVTGRAPNVMWGARPYRRREVMMPWSCGLPLPGWTARVSLKDGIMRMEAQ